MERELRPKSDDNLAATGSLEVPVEDLFDIDPADFVDPEEFGIHRFAKAAGPWGCVWCKIPLLTRQSMSEHHARHCSEQIEEGNKLWHAKHGYNS
jgi:hypothetical protein